MKPNDQNPSNLQPIAQDREVFSEILRLIICRALKAEAESNYPSGPLYGDSLAFALAALLAGHYIPQTPAPARAGGLAPRVLRRVLEFIESDLDGPLRIDHLSVVAGLSPYRFAHNFRIATGLAPHQYVARVRLERAKLMLRETELSVVEIALAIGLQSSSRLNFLFRREMGITPVASRACFRR